jgi:hypothetical protein
MYLVANLVLLVIQVVYFLRWVLYCTPDNLKSQYGNPSALTCHFGFQSQFPTTNKIIPFCDLCFWVMPPLPKVMEEWGNTYTRSSHRSRVENQRW